MNWLAQNWRKASLAIVLAVGVALPALAAYEKTGVFTPPGHHVKLGDNSALRFGDGGGGYSDPTTYDVTARWDGTDLDILANANNTVIKWGNGTNSFDQWLYGSSTSLYLLWDASANDLIFQDSVSAIFGTGLDAELRWDGTDLDLLAVADDQVFKLGNGTNSWDVWLYGNTSADYLLSDASANNLSTQGDFYIALNDFRRGTSGQTGNKTVTATESGTVFLVTGGTGVTFTLPATGTAGLIYDFCNGVNQNMTVTAPASEMVTFNNVDATSVAFSTTNKKTGGCVRVISDANQYYAHPMAEETQTMTVTP